jgi:hypothetical protein
MINRQIEIIFNDLKENIDLKTAFNFMLISI